MNTPLEGIRVLDLTRVLSGPHCTRTLADLGAQVIKLESPVGDLSRYASPRRHTMSSYYVQQNTGKQAVSIDLGQPEGAALVLDLAAACDVVVENFRPGVMDRNGLGYDAVAARNPGVVYASITGYGTTGPWVHRRAYAPVVHAESGLTKSQGDHRDGTYRNDRHSHGDVYAGIECAVAILAALYQRQHTGRGQWLDVSMAQTMLYVNEHSHDDLWEGDIDPNWIRSFGTADYPVLEVANGQQVVVSGHPAERGTFELYMDAIGRADLVADPRFATPADRLRNIHELEAHLQEFASTMPDAEAIEQRFAGSELACGLIRSVADVCATDWADARNVVRAVDDRGGGQVRVPNAPWRFSDAPDVGLHGSPRYRGEDNREVLRDLLGLDDERIAALTESGVLSSHVPGR